ncbi:hypothetical protein TNCV_2524531 [Trichonephila clavipes]|nr:hypothetical protein TNCV_2524531 [Trichonephila clavipes]
MYNKLLLYTAVLRPILTYGSPVWGYAADTNIKILECAIDQPQQCYSDTSGLSRRNRIQEQLSSCNHAFLPRSIYQSGHTLPGRPNHIRPHLQSRYGMEERFAFRFPETPSVD